MTNLTKIESARSDRNAVNAVLEDAKAQNFESVIVIGLTADGVSIRRSRVNDHLKFFGAIEAAKMGLYRMWE